MEDIQELTGEVCRIYTNFTSILLEYGYAYFLEHLETAEEIVCINEVLDVMEMIRSMMEGTAEESGETRQAAPAQSTAEDFNDTQYNYNFSNIPWIMEPLERPVPEAVQELHETYRPMTSRPAAPIDPSTSRRQLSPLDLPESAALYNEWNRNATTQKPRTPKRPEAVKKTWSKGNQQDDVAAEKPAVRQATREASPNRRFLDLDDKTVYSPRPVQQQFNYRPTKKRTAQPREPLPKLSLDELQSFYANTKNWKLKYSQPQRSTQAHESHQRPTGAVPKQPFQDLQNQLSDSKPIITQLKAKKPQRQNANDSINVEHLHMKI